MRVAIVLAFAAILLNPAGANAAGPDRSRSVAAETVPPPTLTGETLLSCSALLSFAGIGCTGTAIGSTATSLSCDQVGQDSFTFTASGVSFAPYPGTFTESGTVTLGDFDPERGIKTLVSWESTFTIDSPVGQVEGTKSLTASLVNGGFCLEPSPAFAGIAFGLVTYYAEITTPDGTYVDRGTATAHVTHSSTVLGGNVFISYGFLEVFTSQLTETTLLFPTDKEECRDGDWQTFGVFKSQGDCVSFVATGGKNKPANSED